MNISWYIYTHESRLVLLASGMQCKSFMGYQVGHARVSGFKLLSSFPGFARTFVQLII